MIERVVTLPITQEELWDVLTDPSEINEWFGAEVAWELEPGGPVHISEDNGAERNGWIDAVEEGHLLRFRWWPNDDESQTSEVTYIVEPDGEGSQLTITERPLVTMATNHAMNHASGATKAGAPSTWETWTVWDDVLVGLAVRTCKQACWC